MSTPEVFKQTINLEKTITSLLEEIKVSEYNSSAATKSKLAMALTLINMAISSIPRLIKIFNFSQKLEEKIFDEKLLTGSMTTEDAIILYRLSIERQSSNIAFISTILNGIKWNEVDAVIAGLSDMRKKVDASDPQTSQIALELLQQMDKLRSFKEVIEPKE